MKAPPATRGPLVFEVLGTPAPKGSMTARIVGGQAIVTPGGSKQNRSRLRAFDGAVREAAREAVGDLASPPFVDVPIIVEIAFRLGRPPGHWGTGKNAGALAPRSPLVPRVKPDLDKLARQTLDAMTGTVFDDDSRIVLLLLAKSYATPGNEGARIRVSPMADLANVRELAEIIAVSLAAGFAAHWRAAKIGSPGLSALRAPRAAWLPPAASEDAQLAAEIAEQDATRAAIARYGVIAVANGRAAELEAAQDVSPVAGLRHGEQPGEALQPQGLSRVFPDSVRDPAPFPPITDEDDFG